MLTRSPADGVAGRPVPAPKPSSGSGWLHRVVIPLGIFLCAVLPYVKYVPAYFTGVDAIPTVAAARASSAEEVLDVTRRELRGGLLPGSSYYRPLTLLSYTWDYALWGWDPRGYHLTDIVLHGLAALAVLALARRAFDLGPWEAAVVALLFVLHPAANEVVPAVSRRQEPMLMMGIAGALIGARGLPRWGAWILLLVSTAVAITSVERGLSTPALVFAYLVLLTGAGSLAARVRRAVILCLPLFFLAVAFYALRGYLFRSSGIGFTRDEVVPITVTYLRWLIYPQDIFAVSRPVTTAGWAAAAALGLAACTAVAYAIWTSPRRAQYLFAGAWIAIHAVFLVVANQVNTWYAYSGVVPLALGLVLLVREGIASRPAMPVRSVWRRGMGLAAAAAGALVAFPLLAASPAIRDYSGWSVASRLTQSVCEDALEVEKRRPPSEGLVLLNVPGSFRESDSDYLVTRSAAILWPHSVLEWMSLHSADQNVAVLGFSRQAGKFRVPGLRLRGNRLRVCFDDAESGYDTRRRPGSALLPAAEGNGVEFEWPPVEVKSVHFATFVFDGEHFVPATIRPDDGASPASCAR